MTSLNSIRLDMGNNPELKDIFMRKKIGDSCKFEIELKIEELSAEAVAGSIKSIKPQGYVDPHGKKEKIEPDTATPISVVVGKKP